MIISLLTLFPEIFFPFVSSSIVGRAQKKNLVTFQFFNIRDFSTDAHQSVDDRPFGGGAGMLLRVDVVERAIAHAVASQPHIPRADTRVILLDPAGAIFSQKKARALSTRSHCILICGHYEGFDARIQHFVDESISIGKFVLSSGEVPALVLIDAIVRLIPQVLSKKEATIEESFTKRGVLEAPGFTRPRVYKGHRVPEILLSGDHARITTWRLQQSQKRTRNALLKKI